MLWLLIQQSGQILHQYFFSPQPPPLHLSPQPHLTPQLHLLTSTTPQPLNHLNFTLTVLTTLMLQSEAWVPQPPAWHYLCCSIVTYIVRKWKVKFILWSNCSFPASDCYVAGLERVVCCSFLHEHHWSSLLNNTPWFNSFKHWLFNWWSFTGKWPCVWSQTTSGLWMWLAVAQQCC